ncbi:MAG TPA: hypothetical protein VFV78_13465 [Vicinamibacterales bacterium]|nr:hypothetical protein [Vicinamibacterales bacterium]
MVVSTPVEMPDWEMTQHRIALIHFDGKSWRVAGKTSAGGRILYQLAPWAPADEYVIGRQIEYNAAYVAARDRHIVATRRTGHVAFLVRCASPLIGFLPARTKEQLEARYGLDPVSATFQSVFLELLVTLCSLVMVVIGIFALGMAGSTAGLSVKSFLALAIIAAVDGSVRYGRILREERPPVGFYEWLVKRQPGL